MKPADVADLYAFMKTLPAVQGKAPGNSLSFPFNIRRGLGLWKLLISIRRQSVAFAAEAPDGRSKAGTIPGRGTGSLRRVPHAAHEFAGGTKKSQWLAGATAAEGDGNVPNITSGEGGIGDWSEGDISPSSRTERRRNSTSSAARWPPW